MNYLNKFFSTNNSVNKIKRFYYPECRNCKHFIPSNCTSEETRIELGRCGYFAEKNVVTGVIKYEYASVARVFSYDCGQEAKYYSPKEIK